MTDPIPIPPVEIFESGRTNHDDGILGSGDIYSTVKVINLTPHETTEIKTAVITLNKDAFIVTQPGNQAPSISVSSIYGEYQYVQWEPMGDLYPPTEGVSPLGSYKHLRVKWDCRVPAGRDDNNYAVNGSIPGPYAHYAEILYNFVAAEPLNTPTFTLTDAVRTALEGNDRVKFQFSAHGYVNEFDFLNGLYGQDKQNDHPNGASLIPAFRDIIYNDLFEQVGSVNDPPTIAGAEVCLAKEYELHGRIVPELDNSVAHFDSETWDSSGNDAPPFWYHFHYELQHNKNIIPFTFIWGVGMVNYDEGTYDPEGKDIDEQDQRINKISSNHGPRRRSDSYLDYLSSIPRMKTSEIRATPNNYYSNDDVTFSVVGPEVVCHASSVNVCAVYSDSFNGKDRTTLNWFDKANASFYDINVFGINNLPSLTAWVLRGCIVLNESYTPVNLTPLDQSAQRSIRKERTWAIDQNFYERKLFGAQKYPITRPPEEFLRKNGFDNAYQTACHMMYTLWESPIKKTLSHPLWPTTLRNTVPTTVTGWDTPAGSEGTYFTVTIPPEWQNPYQGITEIARREDNPFLKNLREPWAMNPIGLANRPGVVGGQPGFANVGGAGVNASIGLPDMRAYEACIDLEWGSRLFIETDRDGSLLDQFRDRWLVNRFIPNFSNNKISNINLENVGKVITGDQNYTWRNKGFDSLEFSGLDNIINSNSIFCYYGTNPTFTGSSNKNFSRGFPRNQITNEASGLNPKKESVGYVLGLGTLSTSSIPGYNADGSEKRGGYRFNYYNPSATMKPFGFPGSKHQYRTGYPSGDKYGFGSDKKQSFTNSHAAFALQQSYAIASGDKVTLKLIDYYIRCLLCSHDHNEADRTLFTNKQLYPEGQAYKNVGRMEGRPLQGIVGGIAITRDSNLRERAIYSLARRFWSNVYIANWEDYPYGVPGKPWRPITYPAWSFDGNYITVDQNKIPYSTNTLSGVTLIRERSFDDHYVDLYLGLRGDLYFKKYLPSRIPIKDLYPNYNRNNSASWNAFSVDGANTSDQAVFCDPYFLLEQSSQGDFEAPGIVNYPDGTSQTQQVIYRHYNLGYLGHPLEQSYAIPPRLNSQPEGVTVNAIPGTRMTVPGDVAETRLRQWKAVGSNAIRYKRQDRYYSQGYQQGLLYPYISPALDYFYNYAKIYEARAQQNQTPEFLNKFGTYELLSAEYLDAWEEIKQYFIRASKSLIQNCLVRYRAPDFPEIDGLYGLSYFITAYSFLHPLENIRDQEQIIDINPDGSVRQESVPFAGNLGLNSGESWPVTPGIPGLLSLQQCKNGSLTYQHDTLRLYSKHGLAGFIGLYAASIMPRRPNPCNPANTIASEIVEGNYGTKIWAGIAFEWAWDILKTYGDPADTEVSRLLEKCRSFIQGMLGTEKYNFDRDIRDGTGQPASVEAAFYKRNFGYLGWPSPGNNPNFEGNEYLGHNEFYPNLDGAGNDHWKDRSLDKIFIDDLRLSMSLSSNIEFTLISNYSFIYLNPLLSGAASFNTTLTSFPTFINASVRDYGNDSISIVSGITEVDTRKYLECDLFNNPTLGLSANINNFTVTSVINSKFDYSTLFSIIFPNTLNLDGVYRGESLFFTYPFSLNLLLDSLVQSFSTQLNVNELDIFKKLANASIEFSTEYDTTLIKLLGLNPISSGATQLSSTINGFFGVDASISGSTTYDVFSVFSNIPMTVEGESRFNSLISLIKGPAWGISQGGEDDGLVNIIEEPASQTNITNDISEAIARSNIIYNRPAYRFERDLWEELTLKVKSDENVSQIFKETLESLINIFSDVVYIDEEFNTKEVPCWGGSMDRVVAKLKKEANTILPVMSLVRLSNKTDEDRRRYGSLIVYEKYWDKQKARAVRVASLPPVPVNISYRLSVWSKYQEDMDHITEQVHRRFNPDIEIYTKYNSTTKAYLVQESSEPPAKLADGENRVIRKTFEIEVQSFIPSPKFMLTNTGKIEKLNAEVCIPINKSNR